MTLTLDRYDNIMEIIESWEGPQADFLGALLMDRLNPKSVVDFGCGPGTYLLPFIRAGCEVLGIDAEPEAGKQLPDGAFMRADLRLPVVCHAYDLALCIEVGEHLKAEHATALVENISHHTNRVFWSAAHPGQGGQYHHNEQPKEYWLDLFARYAFMPSRINAELVAAIAASADCQRVQWLIPNGVLLVRTGYDL